MHIPKYVISILSYTENTPKLLNRFRNLHQNSLSAHGDYGKLGFFIYTNSSPNTLEVFKRILRIYGKFLSAHGEFDKRILPHSQNSPRCIQWSLSRKSFDQNQKVFRS
jgi:hypothetical protein